MKSPSAVKRILATWPLLLAPALAWSGQVQLPLYRADYTISARYGLLSGRAETSSRTEWDEQAGEYRYTTTAEAKGIAGALFPGTGVDVSRFVLDCRGIVAIEHRRDDGSDSRDEDVEVLFDQEASIARVSYQDRELELPAPPGTVDANSLPLAIMLDLIQGLPSGNYLAVDRDKLKDYQVTQLGEETIDSTLGKVQTLVVEQSKPGSSRSRKIWLLKDRDYLPAKMEYRHKGKLRTTMTLEKLTLSGHGPIVDCPSPASNAQPPAPGGD